MAKDIRAERADLKDSVLELYVGECLGRGWSRTVYGLRGDSSRVIKIEHSHKFFSNVMEWKVWEAIKHTPHAIWFAPCHDISANGLALVQERTRPMTEEEFATVTEVPEYLSDVFWGNFGWLDGRVVCHDYGRNNLLRLGGDAAKMVSPKMYSPSNGG